MSEADRRIENLYSHYLKLMNPIARGLIGLARGNTDPERTIHEIYQILRYRPGTYPVARLAYLADSFGSSFEYGFDFKYRELNIEVDYNGQAGIHVQKVPTGHPLEVEVFNVDPDLWGGEDNSPTNFQCITTINLPEGQMIPVGPVYFKGDSLPLSEREIADQKTQAMAMAKSMGLKISDTEAEETFKLFRTEGSDRKHIARYFKWQPVIPGGANWIHIDFNKLDYLKLGLTPENAPTVTNTVFKDDIVDDYHS